MARVGLREWLAIAPVIASGRLSRYGGGEGGPLARFEADFSTSFGVRHTLAVCNGTAALIAALVSAGIGPSDEVLVPAYTWIATAGAVLATGAVPVLVDIDETLTIDPLDIERKITPRTRAIIPVHMANMVCDMDSIMGIARRHGLVVVEDACQAVGASYKGRRVGTIGDAGAFSFNQFKNISIGEGGAIVTNDDRLFARARMYHDIGSVFRGHLDNANEPPFCGVNLKASQIQGAMLNVQLGKLDPMIARMRRRYDAMAAILTAARGPRVGPHNDRPNAIGLHVIFDTEKDAQAFASENPRGVHRVHDSSRHVYSFWQPILQQRAAHPRMDPFVWASRPMDYSQDVCARSLEILKRTCRISLGENYPLPVMTFLARRMGRHRNVPAPVYVATPDYGT
ncbi:MULTISPECIES: DegT/DnrJ/EryC1/StrS family aminotransferase [Alphaproteobacteria]|uniref:8-amino-3,8-dideoxy-alpha-D-manno-octulosonate transaminase n=2 Tax=Alphaproteobacteria TaxID=28211 RepID=A0A512HN41_9HYPH|nr:MULTISPECIES: DegT/DnrJ/EryC1/StrS family aminotransferase [Alphaproteobacteria]GEO86862.1 8-amino-3,8-dideoxy-alpha-D-manno-octulosonate transaminase [Ciceribacter naphthalenivorans]GLR24006.1 8-amino-3,8-dideoxy-alpha-D-manno-octulosonate transaminase [Ciceribacter naphthalenivorans]GLT06862.1 8-amino-3,8-dideoxy-alpha-D-manno-octulosonate transaminase [Sphingomonas psychrolutea]